MVDEASGKPINQSDHPIRCPQQKGSGVRTNSAGVLSLKRDSAVAAVKKAAELMGDGTRDVHITAPDGRVYSDVEFAQLNTAAGT
jgi:hypothetical protein